MGKVGQLVQEAQEFAKITTTWIVQSFTSTLLLISGSTQFSCVKLSHTGKRFRPRSHCLMMQWSSMSKILSLRCMLTTISPEDYNCDIEEGP